MIDAHTAHVVATSVKAADACSRLVHSAIEQEIMAYASAGRFYGYWFVTDMSYEATYAALIKAGYTIVMLNPPDHTVRAIKISWE